MATTTHHSVTVGMCPECGVWIDDQGWPLRHQNPEGDVCAYDWTTDDMQQLAAEGSV